MKRIICMILAACMACSIMLTVSAEESAFVLSSTADKVKRGDRLTLSLDLAEPVTAKGIQLSIVYDVGSFSAVSYKAGNALAGAMMSEIDIAKPGKINIAAAFPQQTVLEGGIGTFELRTDFSAYATVAEAKVQGILVTLNDDSIISYPDGSAVYIEVDAQTAPTRKPIETEKPKVTQKPTAYPEVTKKPTASPGATNTPSASPGATITPAVSPGATNTPAVSPGATNTPTASPGAAISPTGLPDTSASAKPSQTAEPSAGASSSSGTSGSSGSSGPLSASRPGSSAVSPETEDSTRTETTAKPQENTPNADSHSIFKDIENHWAKTDIEELYKRNIVNGVTEALFFPDKNITRAEFIKLIAAALNLEEKHTDSFEDVKAEAWYNGYVGALESLGIIMGDKGLCRPEDNINRQEMTVIIQRAFSVRFDAEVAIEFDDSELISDWAAEAVMTLAGVGIIKGMDNNCFEPLSCATRAQAAVILSRILSFQNG